ncbi:E3 ubiquitin-protein ligase RGLG1 [Capsicum annuum]|nr:E3 ubiquitin-protein ligase RGLG1 [Capsicum annuum]
MGNQESGLNDTHSDNYHPSPEHVRNQIGSNPQYQPTTYAESSVDSNYRAQVTSYAGVSDRANYLRNQQASYIADNFKSLDEVNFLITCSFSPDFIELHRTSHGGPMWGHQMAMNKESQVVTALREAGLESSNLILGIDFTKSNEWTGRSSFNRRSLHSVGHTANPYEQAISIIGRTLSPFDEDNLIPCFGFGDASTHDQHVFSFYPDHRPCHGFEEALARYKEIVPYLKLSENAKSGKLEKLPPRGVMDGHQLWNTNGGFLGINGGLNGPTSFAPIVNAAIDIVEANNGQYHVLVIIADGQVTRSIDTPSERLSPQEQTTVNSIVAASEYPLSIILVGVGDGPWDEMKRFDDNIPQRAFDNFQNRMTMRSETEEEKEGEGKDESLLSVYTVTEARLLYSDSAELLDIVDCFLDFQDTIDSPIFMLEYE